MFSIEAHFKQSQGKFLESQNPQQKYLISDQDGNRTLNEAMRLLQAKKITKIHICQKCNKKFQSLTALSTHSKKQHGFIPLLNGEQRKRGRPRRDAPRPSDQFTQWQQQYVQKQKESLLPKRQCSLSSLNPDQVSAFAKLRRVNHIIYSQCEKFNDVDGLVCTTLLDEKESIQRLLDLLQPISEEHEIIKILEEINSNDDQEFVLLCYMSKYLTAEQPVSQLFAAFLINVGTFSTDRLLRLTIIFIKALFSYIANRGKQDLQNAITEETQGLMPEDKNRVYYDIMPVNLFPLLCNSFMPYFPTYIKNFDSMFAALLLKDMCDWLYREIKGFVVNINL